MLTPQKKRVFLIWAAVLMGVLVLRAVIYRGPLAAVSRLAGYEVIYPLDAASELFLHEKTLTYDVSYFGVLPLGKMIITTRRTPEGVTLRLRVTTEGAPLGSVLKAYAEAASLLDPVTLIPRQYREATDVNGKRTARVFLFDYEDKVVRQGESVIAIDEDARDVLSAFFLLLSQAPSRETLTAPFVFKKALYNITLTALNQKIGVAAYRADIRRSNQASSHGPVFKVWIAKSTTRTPVLITAWTPVGYFSAFLTQVRSDEKSTPAPEGEETT